MELRQLRYFVKTAEKLNFTEAAKALFITQSTLSQQVKQLETELGAPLFDRVGKKVYLTEAGSEFLPFAEKTIMDANFGLQRLQDLHDVRTGEINIGIIYSIIPKLPAVMAEFAKSYPSVKINIAYHQTHNLHTMLAERRYDLIICYQTDDNPGMEDITPLYQNTLSAVATKNHPLAIRKNVPVSLLSEYPLALPTSTFYARSRLNMLADKHNITLQPEVEMNGVSLLQQLVKTGHWVTVLSDVIADDDENFVAIPLADKVQMTTAVISLKDTYMKHAARLFKDILVKHLKKQ